jgi:hypothetical protein
VQVFAVNRHTANVVDIRRAKNRLQELAVKD